MTLGEIIFEPRGTKNKNERTEGQTCGGTNGRTRENLSRTPNQNRTGRKEGHGQADQQSFMALGQ
jgi:hypothetical protein